jgi:two-component system phosphate regulon sensor histidine kinase PhoR
VKIEKSGNLDVLDNAQFEIFFKDIASMPLSRTGFSRDFTETDKKGIRGSGVKKNLNLEYIIWFGH